jgi:translation initiation factor 5B
MLRSVDKDGNDVYVQASALGSLEALLAFVKQGNIAMFSRGVGPADPSQGCGEASVMLDRKGKEEYAVMLAFDVKIAPEALEEAENLGVRIFTADIISLTSSQRTWNR